MLDAMIVLAALAVGISLAPYHGPLLPGSEPGTAKFGVHLQGTPSSRVRLRVADLPAGWLASFCTNRVCAPLRVTLTLPRDGKQLIELQVIQNEGRTAAPRVVTVLATGGTRASIPFSAATRS